jgi:hypothetical protein
VTGVPRRILGTVVLPPDAPTTTARAVVVELRDVTYADAHARVIVNTVLPGVALHPHGRVPFDLLAPEAQPGQQLSLECHIDVTGGTTLAAGDLVSTQSIPVPAEGDARLDVPVSPV